MQIIAEKESYEENLIRVCCDFEINYFSSNKNSYVATSKKLLKKKIWTKKKTEENF